MAGKQSIIGKNYEEIVNASTGAQFVKVDLHVHTPASGDAQAKNKYNFKFDINDIPKSLKSAKELAEKIVDGAIEKELRLIAITDHNTPSNTHPEDLTNTWYQLIKDAAKDKDLCVLPGVEISTDDLHILVIVDPKEDEKAVYTTHRINFLLRDCKFTLKEYGDYRATGMSSLFDVLEYIETLGSSCIAIPAHIDGGKKAMLEVYKGPGNVFNKLLNHPNLNAVEVVKDTTPTRKKIGGRKGKIIKEYFDGLRDDNRSPIAYIQNSDAHMVKDIGKRFTYVRMGDPCFWSLKNALEDPQTRVQMKKDYKPEGGKTKIIGIAFGKGKKWDYIAFNQNLNCIIGKKRTRKSTLVDLILYGLNRFDRNEEKWLIDAGYSVNVFMAKGSDVFCYFRGGERKADIFKLENNSFVPFEGKPSLELPKKYNHASVEEIFSQTTKLIKFLDRRIFTGSEIQTLIKRRDKHLEKIKKKGFENCQSDTLGILDVCDKLFRARNKYIKASLEKYGKIRSKNRFDVKIKKGKWDKIKAGKWESKNEDDLFDRAKFYVLVNSRYKPINRLSTGDRNAAIMVLLMNQGEFGPLIIDEPEQYLDVSSITGMLIPRMRRLKTRQQIICVTKDEHIVLSGDAEQVIATQSEDKIDVVTGDINSKVIQDQILEIFEGDRFSLMDKNRKLGSILE